MTFTCDTSVLVAALAVWHEDHAASRRALAEVRSVPAHVLIECYSVLTRLPAGHRIAPAMAGDAIGALSWKVVDLPDADKPALIAECAASEISGGAVYDALVGATARHHGLTLLTRDRRALRTYEALGVGFELM